MASSKSYLYLDPWSFPTRTPGILGKNDAADPDSADWFVGDTPGSVGINDRGDPTSQPESNIDIKRGEIQIAFNIEPWGVGHGTITDAGVAIFKLPEKMPERAAPSPNTERRITQVFDRIREAVIAVDYNLPAHVFAFGQKHHFMAIKGQPKGDAYKAGVKHIFDSTEDAIRIFKLSINKNDSFAPFDPHSIARHLGYAFHALQDSFSPVHTQRDENLVITDLFVYKEQDKNDHDHGDDLSVLYKGQKEDADIFKIIEIGKQSSDRNESEKARLVEAAIAASGLLLKYFKFRVLNEDAQAMVTKELLMSKYLATNLR